ncbi:hypothetical protein AG1IA_03194 [Rhizoctonia solani AG-1 IA]|uniref:Uncharacterized protein n=1 Tax=Thanatephorus cucumeris (strain AG1-IA) TaxID=983506 RepID=L8WXK4_THACA|nr:hypothetical protein AG1IA_03194 [Rhizoctonia solani AG-1 IA]
MGEMVDSGGAWEAGRPMIGVEEPVDCLRRWRVRRLRAENHAKSMRAARARIPRMTRRAMAHLGKDESPPPFWSDPVPLEPAPGVADAVAAAELAEAMAEREEALIAELTLAAELNERCLAGFAAVESSTGICSDKVKGHRLVLAVPPASDTACAPERVIDRDTNPVRVVGNIRPLEFAIANVFWIPRVPWIQINHRLCPTLALTHIRTGSSCLGQQSCPLSGNTTAHRCQRFRTNQELAPVNLVRLLRRCISKSSGTSLGASVTTGPSASDPAVVVAVGVGVGTDPHGREPDIGIEEGEEGDTDTEEEEGKAKRRHIAMFIFVTTHPAQALFWTCPNISILCHPPNVANFPQSNHVANWAAGTLLYPGRSRAQSLQPNNNSRLHQLGLPNFHSARDITWTKTIPFLLPGSSTPRVEFVHCVPLLTLASLPIVHSAPLAFWHTLAHSHAWILSSRTVYRHTHSEIRPIAKFRLGPLVYHDGPTIRACTSSDMVLFGEYYTAPGVGSFR